VPDRVLAAYAFFRDGDAGLREDILRLAEPVRSRPESGHPLYTAGDACRGLFLVGSGSLRIYVSGHSGRNVSLYHVKPGELCPVNLRSVLAEDALLASADAEGELTAATLGLDGLRYLVDRHKDFRSFILETITARFGDVIRQIADVTTRSVDYRIARFLEAAARDLPPHGTIFVTNDLIAADIGASREVVNRKLRALRDVGVVQLGRGRIKLLDLEKITRIKEI